MGLDWKQIAGVIDHSLLQSNTNDDDLQTACEIARKYSVACLIVKPYMVPKAVEAMRGSGIPVGTTVGFPHGANSLRTKACEAEVAIADGAMELDMVANIGAAKSGNWLLVEQDIAAVVEVAKKQNVPLKVIIEACYLTDEEKVKICGVVKAAGAQFVKSTTGYGAWGAKAEDIVLMRKTVGPDYGVKASGGIRTLEAVLDLLAAGANRIGTSSTQAIVEECIRRQSS